MKSTALAHTPSATSFPAGTSAQYAVRLAGSRDEIRAAQHLRFQVFNLELSEGLDRSYATGLDQDRFDSVCDHLIAVHVPTGELAGTYRIQTGLSALAGIGYYSEQEFDFGPYEGLRPEMVEVGRACVGRRHRNLSALGTLWRGIAQYAKERRARYLVGCSSLPTLDPAAGWSVYNQLCESHLCPPPLFTSPAPGWECMPVDLPSTPFSVPKLLRAYLGLGAVICAHPAQDRQFGTIDFLTLLDLESLPEAARLRFLR